MKDNDTDEELMRSEEWTEAGTIVSKAQETISS
jgi:hypothetical protein